MEKIFSLVLQIFGMRTAKQKEKMQRVIDYIDTILEHMGNIMGYKKDVNEAVFNSQESFFNKLIENYLYS